MFKTELNEKKKKRKFHLIKLYKFKFQVRKSKVLKISYILS